MLVREVWDIRRPSAPGLQPFPCWLPTSSPTLGSPTPGLHLPHLSLCLISSLYLGPLLLHACIFIPVLPTGAPHPVGSGAEGLLRQ